MYLCLILFVTSFFQADIKPQTDGANGLKYNLTADIIESIFKTYPMGEFWECLIHFSSQLFMIWIQWDRFMVGL